jgi:hypothetical protein
LESNGLTVGDRRRHTVGRLLEPHEVYHSSTGQIAEALG